MNMVLNKIPALVAEELEAANNIHKPFHSAHEGYAVLLEEVEEAREELDDVESRLMDAWEAIKCDNPLKALSQIRNIEWTAIKLAAEAIQIAAMARKYQDSLGGADR